VRDVVEERLTVETRFASFDDFWEPFLERMPGQTATWALSPTLRLHVHQLTTCRSAAPSAGIADRGLLSTIWRYRASPSRSGQADRYAAANAQIEYGLSPSFLSA